MEGPPGNGVEDATGVPPATRGAAGVLPYQMPAALSAPVPPAVAADVRAAVLCFAVAAGVCVFTAVVLRAADVVFERRYTPLRVGLLVLMSGGWVSAWYGAWGIARAAAGLGKRKARGLAFLSRAAGTAFLLVPFLWAIETWGEAFATRAPLTAWVSLISYPLASALLAACITLLLIRADSPVAGAIAILLGLAWVSSTQIAVEFCYFATNSLELLGAAPPYGFVGPMWLADPPDLDRLFSTPIRFLPFVAFALEVFVLVRLWLVYRRPS